MTKPRAPFPLNDLSDFKAWKRQEPNAEKLVFKVIFYWRGSSARLRDRPGKWVAYPREFWANVAQLSIDQTKRALRTLELDGLLLRARGRFNGSNVHPFLQPTRLALINMGKTGDLERLERSLAPIAAPAVAPTNTPSVAPINAPTSAPTDYTSLPSPSSSLSSHTSQKGAQPLAHQKGKEGSGERVKNQEKKKIKLKMKLSPKGSKGPPPNDNLEGHIAAAKAEAKKERAKKLLPILLSKFPILQGAHEKAVKHPYQMHGEKWAGWSPKLIVERHTVYVEMVENWYTGKEGKAYKPLSYDDVDFELDLDIPDIEEHLLKK